MLPGACFGDVSGAIDQRVLAPDEINRNGRTQIACVHRHASREVGRKLGGMGAFSPSAALQQTYDDCRSQLDEFLD